MSFVQGFCHITWAWASRDCFLKNFPNKLPTPITAGTIAAM